MNMNTLGGHDDGPGEVVSVGDRWTKPRPIGEFYNLAANEGEVGTQALYYVWLDLKEFGIEQPTPMYIESLRQSHTPKSALQPLNQPDSYHIDQRDLSADTRRQKLRELGYPLLVPNDRGVNSFHVYTDWLEMFGDGSIAKDEDGNMRIEPHLLNVLSRLRIRLTYPGSETTSGGSLVSMPIDERLTSQPPGAAFEHWRPDDLKPLPTDTEYGDGYLLGADFDMMHPGYPLAIAPEQLELCSLSFKIDTSASTLLER